MMGSPIHIEMAVVIDLCQIETWRSIGGGTGGTAAGRRKRTVLSGFMLRLDEVPVTYGLHVIKDPVLLLEVFFFCPTTLPAITPVRDQPAEAVSIHLQRRCKTDDKIRVGHFIFVHICVQET